MMLCTKETLDYCSGLAIDAGKEILRLGPRSVAVTTKADASPVSEADIAAHHIIRQGLLSEFPDITIVSEEGDEFTQQAEAAFWLVDPLDGTKGFLRGEPEYTVNIALVVQRRPVLGVIYVPAMGMLYTGAENLGAWKSNGVVTPIRVKDWAEGEKTVVVSRHHRSPDELERLRTHGAERVLEKNSSYKFCMVAEGSAHLYPRTGPTMEWDTAAGHAIVNAAGGEMVTRDGTPFLYGKTEFRNPGFIARGTGF